MTSEKTTWQNTIDGKKGVEFKPLNENIVTDVVIVGGGITGTTLAYLLSRAGKKVTVLEKGTLTESSTTAYTTAFLTYEIDTRLQDLVKMFGKDKAQGVWNSGIDAIDLIESIIFEEKIECEFTRCPLYIYANSESEWSHIKKEAELAKEASFKVEIHPNKKTKDKLPFKNFGYVQIPDQAKFHPLKYVAGLREHAVKYGAQFFENTEAVSMDGTKIVTIKTKSGHSVKAEFVIVATYVPFHKPKELFAKKGMYTSYVYELDFHGLELEEALYMDGANPYHYFRVDKTGQSQRVIIGGEDHREEIKIDSKKNFKALREYSEELLGRDYKIKTKWDSGVLETIDGLPYIGPYSGELPNRLVATGFSGNGMTYSMVAGVILCEYIMGKKNKYEEIYTPRRDYSLYSFFIKSRDYAGEFWNGALKNIFK
jgi:glycine/D-amino acid oxidase-like deaminating enzyme